MSWDIFSKSKIQYFLQKLKDKFVQKETGKGLSTNDYTTAEKNKVAQIDNTTTSISGNPISISGLKSNQLAVNPIITLEPIQAGSGTPSPSNIRAISGYDKIEVLSCGKNIWDGTFKNTYLENGTTYKSDSSCRTAIIRVKANTYYTIYKNGGTRFVVAESTEYPVENGVYNKLYERNGATTVTQTVQTSVNIKYLIVYCTNDNTSNIQVQCEEGQTATTYEAPNKATSISESLGQTVYFASDDVRAGDLSNLGDAVDLGSLTWDYRGGVGAGIFSTNIEPKYLKSAVDNAICEIYDNGGGAGGVSVLVDKPTETFCFYIGATNDYILYIKDTNYTDATTFKNAITGKKIVFKKETINHIQHTPHEIPLLNDYAYLSTNGTNIALDYHNGELASLADVETLGQTMDKAIEFAKTYHSPVHMLKIHESYVTGVDFFAPVWMEPFAGRNLCDALVVNNGQYTFEYSYGFRWVGDGTIIKIYETLNGNASDYLTAEVLW